LMKGFQHSMSRAGTPTDNGYAERFVGLFKLAVAGRRSYRTLGEFLHEAERWINFYNQLRPHEGLDQQSPDHYARDHGLPMAPYLPLLYCSVFWVLDNPPSDFSVGKATGSLLHKW
jgi:putative transposase